MSVLVDYYIGDCFILLQRKKIVDMKIDSLHHCTHFRLVSVHNVNSGTFDTVIHKVYQVPV